MKEHIIIAFKEAKFPGLFQSRRRIGASITQNCTDKFRSERSISQTSQDVNESPSCSFPLEIKRLSPPREVQSDTFVQWYGWMVVKTYLGAEADEKPTITGFQPTPGPARLQNRPQNLATAMQVVN